MRYTPLFTAAALAAGLSLAAGLFAADLHTDVAGAKSTTGATPIKDEVTKEQRAALRDELIARGLPTTGFDD